MKQRRLIAPPTLTLSLLMMLMSIGLHPTPAHGELRPLDRPRIGLVLSGGGARGAAHVGVLKVLEEHRIPIDLIVGTSMGANVGAFYSAGNSAADIEEFFKTTDWASTFVDDPPRRDLSFRRKQDDQSFLIKFDVGYNGGAFQFPRGLIQGQKPRLILRKWTSSVSAVEDFDDLPTPYRAVATDIETGQMVVLSRGDLARSAAASMAAPGVFAPVEIDDRLLVDGGVSNNLPVDVARALGADVVIAVDVGFPLVGRDELKSALEISGQMLTILIKRRSDEQLASLTPRDIAILPELGDFSSTDFARVADAIPIGEAAAMAQMQRLQAYRLDPEAYQAYLSTRKLPASPSPVVAAIKIENESRLSEELIRSYISQPLGQALDIASLETDIRDIYGLGAFEAVDYSLSQESEEASLTFHTQQKSWGPNYVNFGIELQDDFEGSSNYNLGARYTRTAINSLGAEWRTDFQVGREPGLFTEFFQPLDHHNGFFIAPQFQISKSVLNLFDDGNRLGELKIDQAVAQVDLGRQFGNWGEFRIGVRRGSGSARVRIGDPDLLRLDFDRGDVFASFGYDRLDNANFPRHGTRADIEWVASRKSLGASDSFESIDASFIRARTFDKYTLLYRFSAQTNLEGDAPIQNSFSLGGLFNLSGRRNDELFGQHAGLANIAFYRRIGGDSSSPLNTDVYLGGSVEFGNVWDDSDDISLSSGIWSGAVFLGIDTVLGPLYVAYGLTEGGQTAGYFFLGPIFGRQ